MEHGLILLIEAILAADRNLQKPLAKYLPDLDRLRDDPKTYFASQEVLIGPRRSYAVSTVLGLLAGVIVLIVLIVARADQPNLPPVGIDDLLLGFLAIVVTAAASTALLLRWLRGGAAVLGADGVQLLYRGRTVFCPWSLFQAPGSPYRPDHYSVILPIDDRVPVAMAVRGGDVVAMSAADLSGKPLAAQSDAQATLHDLYEVRAVEFGDLLLHIGRRLGNGPAAGVAASETSLTMPAPLATPEGNGWARIRLTQLPFPPICAGCGVPTPGHVALPVGSTKGHAIVVPLCPACQAERDRRRAVALTAGIGLGIVLPLCGVGIVSLFLGGEAFLALLIVLPIGVLLGTIVGLILRDRANPVRFRKYSPGAGTVQLRVGNPSGGASFMQALGVANPT
ncbi:MAG: hypothetical protein U0746_11855 [Gemmataceae bacterium]